MLKQIPKFKNEDEERKFWDDVDNIFDYLDPGKFVRIDSPKNEDAFLFRVPHSMKENIERLSKEKHVSVEVLIRDLVAEGLQHRGLQAGI